MLLTCFGLEFLNLLCLLFMCSYFLQASAGAFTFTLSGVLLLIKGGLQRTQVISGSSKVSA